MHVLRRSLLFPLLLLPVLACAQTLPQPDAKAVRASNNLATTIRETQVYIGPATDSGKLIVVTPGHEMAIVETAANGWVRVFANTDVEPGRDELDIFNGTDAKSPPRSGWVLEKGVVRKTDPAGALVLFGAAVSAEEEASTPHARHSAAQDARLMYKRVSEFYPDSPLAPEAAWRAADIRWQMQAADARTLPSAHEKDAYMRVQVEEEEMKKIEKKYPGTKYASLAAWDLIQNKMCGDWQGTTKCPEKEADIYMKYVEQHPDSPKAAQATYNAAWRLAAAADIHDSNDEKPKAQADRAKAQELAAQTRTKFPQSDYAARAATLEFKLKQGIPIYGSDRD